MSQLTPGLVVLLFFPTASESVLFPSLVEDADQVDHGVAIGEHGLQGLGIQSAGLDQCHVGQHLKRLMPLRMTADNTAGVTLKRQLGDQMLAHKAGAPENTDIFYFHAL